MKNKIKKIITTTVISAVSLTAIGCGTNNSKLAHNIDKSMEEFVSSINKLDYVETTASAKAPTSNKIGKIVEASANENSSMKIRNTGNHIQFLNNNISEAEIENTITIPSERTDNFNLFVLSSTPYVTFTSDDNNSLNINVKFSTNQIEETSDEIESKINSLILKRSILMIYVNEIYNGNVNISNDDKLAINAYVNVIKENTSFLNGNRGMVKNQLSLASDLASSESNENLINYYIIKSGEALETRANKLDSTISAIDSIIKIIENNLTSSSAYYQTNLSNTYETLTSNFKSSNSIEEITELSTNQEIANKIACTLDFCEDTKTKSNSSNVEENTNNSTSTKTIQPSQDHTVSENLNNTNKNNTPAISNKQTKDIRNLNQIQNKRRPSNQQNTTQESTQNTQNENNITNDSNDLNNNQNQTNKRRQFPRISRRRIQPNKELTNQTNNNPHYVQNLNTQDQNNNLISSNNTKIRERNSIMNNNENTLRANRTPENNINEEYTMSSAAEHENRATRVPYRSISNIQK